jgi:hypothetical protein
MMNLRMLGGLAGINPLRDRPHNNNFRRESPFHPCAGTVAGFAWIGLIAPWLSLDCEVAWYFEYVSSQLGVALERKP